MTVIFQMKNIKGLWDSERLLSHSEKSRELEDEQGVISGGF